MTPTLLVLWDIDLTLVKAGPFGRGLYAAAFQRVTGQPMRTMASAAGRLDPDIFRDTLVANGLDPDQHPFPPFANALTAEYEAGAGKLSRLGSALPGARQALDRLAGEPLAVQTVLTGNVRTVAAVKLGAFGLDRHLDLEVGAYGTEAGTRAGLVALARQRAGAKGSAPFGVGRTVLIGDSRHDVTAGLEGGARVIAVATGRDSASDLRAAGATTILPSLTDTDGLMRAIWNASG